jgi:CheY-like chemotaxis protein
MRILLVDDHAVVRSGIRQILQDTCAPEEIGEAADAGEALRAIYESDWDLVFLDIRLPGRSGIEVLRQIKANKPGLPVLILSTYPESQYASRKPYPDASTSARSSVNFWPGSLTTPIATATNHHTSYCQTASTRSS